MSQRNIELQISIPKVTEVAKIQQQLQQQQLNQQAAFEQTMHKQIEKEIHRPNQADENQTVSNQNQQTGDQSSTPGSKRRRKKAEQQEAKHPYKGKHIDLRG
ncbi:hypothetical protein [Effusibacillus dendaii]|uniref:RNA polymerase subunit sigma n=1 Tax=Effusibacillus dendaii TaxID=2743772 RepID=A0A7I8D8E4_9BACL|nr:hypothetical protein [Effusibacillus dendaii]BCJ85289.1 hypothetical protein skT53_02740 [Effusibacillus dendaii]